MKRAYLVGGLLFVVCIAAAIYYLTTGHNHILVSDDPNGQHIKHALLFFGLAILSLVGARFVANSTPRQS